MKNLRLHIERLDLGRHGKTVRTRLPLFVLAMVHAHVYGSGVCLETATPCAVQDSAVNMRVVLRADGTLINGAQLVLAYDPAQLTFVSIESGSHCDSASPFAQEVFSSIDEEDGLITYAVSPLLGQSGSANDATLACLRFVVRNDDAEVCLSTAGSNSFLVDANGQPVTIDNTSACPETQVGTSACRTVSLGDSCNCTEGAPDCSLSSSACAVGVCREDGAGARCVGEVVPDGTTCDDGSACSSEDRCVDGFCAGTGCENPSLCLVPESACGLPGGLLVRVELGDGATPVLGGQFLLSYAPGEVEVLDVLPGSFCDEGSPFDVEIEKILDPQLGQVFYAVGVNFSGGTAGTTGPSTLACLQVAPVGNVARQLCISEGENPLQTILGSSTGQSVEIYEGLVCPTNEPGSLTCTELTVPDDCQCEESSGDCAIFDTECREGYCGFGGVCLTQAINNNGSCDDGSDCSINDRCIQGTCRGFKCGDPSLCIDGPGCVGPGLPRRMTVRMGSSDQEIVGAQFLLSYDPTTLQFVSISPGAACDDDSPFSNEVFLALDESIGEIFYAVGIDPSQGGTTGPAAMACLEFIALKPDAGDVCLLRGVNPFRSLFSDAGGGKIQIYNNLDCPYDGGLPQGDVEILACENVCTVPTTGRWGIIALALSVGVLAKVMHRRHWFEHAR
ncbi:MAG: cohesin domain-containing protein [Phycisphaerae bacterium]